MLRGEQLEDRKLMAADAWGIDMWVASGCPNDVIARDPDHGNAPAIFADGFESGDVAAYSVNELDGCMGRFLGFNSTIFNHHDGLLLRIGTAGEVAAIDSEMEALGDHGDQFQLQMNSGTSRSNGFLGRWLGPFGGISNLPVGGDVFHVLDRMDHRWPDHFFDTDPEDGATRNYASAFVEKAEPHAAITGGDWECYLSDIADAIANEMDSLGDVGDALQLELNPRDGYKLNLALSAVTIIDRQSIETMDGNCAVCLVS